MSANLKIIDRRKHKRFRAPDGAFTILLQEPHLTLLGKILDISRGGLSFRYLDCKKEVFAPSKVGIVLHSRNFYLHNIPVKTVSNIEVMDKKTSSSEVIMRCSMHFAGLNTEQKIELENFIRNYTTGVLKA